MSPQPHPTSSTRGAERAFFAERSELSQSFAWWGSESAHNCAQAPRRTPSVPTFMAQRSSWTTNWRKVNMGEWGVFDRRGRNFYWVSPGESKSFAEDVEKWGRFAEKACAFRENFSCLWRKSTAFVRVSSEAEEHATRGCRKYTPISRSLWWERITWRSTHIAARLPIFLSVVVKMDFRSCDSRREVLNR